MNLPEDNFLQIDLKSSQQCFQRLNIVEIVFLNHFKIEVQSFLIVKKIQLFLDLW